MEILSRTTWIHNMTKYLEISHFIWNFKPYTAYVEGKMIWAYSNTVRSQKINHLTDGQESSDNRFLCKFISKFRDRPHIFRERWTPRRRCGGPRTRGAGTRPTGGSSGPSSTTGSGRQTKVWKWEDDRIKKLSPFANLWHRNTYGCWGWNRAQ